MELNFRLNMGGEDLVIAIAQDWQTNDVLGESSGNVQTVKEMYIDCDADAIIMKVEQIGAACHEGYRSCFFRQLDIDKENIDIDNLTDDDVKVISERLFDPKEMYG